MFARPREPQLAPVPLARAAREHRRAACARIPRTPVARDRRLGRRPGRAARRRSDADGVPEPAAQRGAGAAARAAGSRVDDRGRRSRRDDRDRRQRAGHSRRRSAAKIFEPFFTTKHRGTGLGLPTARRVVERHRGTIDVECPPGGGTVVTVTLADAVSDGSRRGRLDELVLRVADGQHRARRAPDDLLGDAAEQHVASRRRARACPSRSDRL